MRRCAFLGALLVLACARRPRPAAVVGAIAGDSLELVVAATTDVHGWLRGWDYFANRPDTTRGLARIATIIDSLRAVHAGHFVLVDAGDDLQGTALATVAMQDSLRRNPIIAAMNALRYDAAVIGNNEFNYGMGYLNRAAAEATFPLLAANAFSWTGEPAYTPWVMLTRAGVRIAVVGATTPGSMIWDGGKLRGRLSIRDIVPSVRRAVEDARRRGADVVVVVLHSGLDEPSSYDTVTSGVASENVSARVAREVPGIDVVVFGHSHKELRDTSIGTTLLTQPKNWATSLAVVRLRVARAAEGSRWRVVDRRAQLIRARGHLENAAVLTAIADAHARAVAYSTSAIGSTAWAWSADSARVKDTPIIDFILEVERRTAGSDLASTAAFNLNAHFGPGQITMADLAAIYPYDNNVLRAVKITGRQLREYLEHSARYYRDAASSDSLVDPRVPGFNFDIVAGVDYTIDLSRPAGSRITGRSPNGRPATGADTLTMALNDYRQAGGGGYGMLRGAPVVYDQQQVIRQLLVDEVRRKGALNPADYFTANWRLAPDSLVSAAYRSMRRLPFDRPAP